MDVSLFDRLFLLLIYSFLGWAVGVGCLALREGKFINRGLLNMPLAISEGITAVILMDVLPTLHGNLLYQMIMTGAVVWVMDELSQFTLIRLSRYAELGYVRLQGFSNVQKLFLRSAETLLYLMVYLLVHPFILAFVNWLPSQLVIVLTVVLSVAVAVDFWTVYRALRSGKPHHTGDHAERTQRLADRMTCAIWNRLERAYPGVQELELEEQTRYTFARGMCFDKLVWVFLLSSFLGALIEMVYCRLVGGTWMSRSSVLYGPFSIVWGLGAVVLTVVLRRLVDKPARYVFLGGFVVGGVYEYLCSVFTEIVFGTVFWDYSYMPLNIGGRTNVLFCVFWGILSVVWLRAVYPSMERTIEKIPPLWGKVVTWILLLAMLCDGLLTGAAMLRYTQRQENIPADHFIAAFVDEQYDDKWMENRWPNMIVTE